MYRGSVYVKYSTGSKRLSDEQFEQLCKDLTNKFGGKFESGGHASGNALEIYFVAPVNDIELMSYLDTIKPKLAISLRSCILVPGWSFKELAQELKKLMPKRLDVKPIHNDRIEITGGKFGDGYFRIEFRDIEGKWLLIRNDGKVDVTKPVRQVAQDIYEFFKQEGMLAVSIEEAVKILDENGIQITDDGKIKVSDLKKAKELLR